MIRIILNNMDKNQIRIIKTFTKSSILGFGEIFDFLKIGNTIETVSEVTIKRNLTKIVELGILETIGAGRSLKYKLTAKGLLLYPIEEDAYMNISESERGGQTSFDFNLFDNLDFDIFSIEEMQTLDKATEKYNANAIDAGIALHKKELERFIIELAWKSSKIEGNTYSLLDTEFLLREGLRSEKNTESEATMILNHKKAFDYIYQNRVEWRAVSLRLIEEVHSLLMNDLGVIRNIRKSPVGVTGTSYVPIDNEFQIKEAIDNLIKVINKRDNFFEKALLSIICISYIQPFEDGNKRTSRLIGNAILLAHDLAPLSYRDVDEVRYRAASLVFYEQNSIQAFKKIFIDQYIYSCGHYNIAPIPENK